ncbi:MAG TPA: aspartate carbamoyltransferase, partial [Deinococcales bacterium]|nr:aspartate carbamoyltransferase [Deinococcales bacterium]
MSAEPLPAPAAPHRHLFDFHDWSAADVLALFDTADVMAGVMQRTIKKVPALQGFTVGLMFFEDSTRTRLSFDRAARAQSADVVTFSSGGSSLSKGESLRDTIETVDAMQADLYVIRHPASGAQQQISRWTDAAIVNAGDGRRAHPTQALLDAYTFLRSYGGAEAGTLQGKKLAIVGDVLHSRVARSNAELWTKLGAEVTLCGPATLLPHELAGPGVTLTNNVAEAVEGAHAVMALRL